MHSSKTLNKPVKNQPKSRNPKGSPRPYKDGNRWKAPGKFVDNQGIVHKVIGSGSTQHMAIKSRDALLAKKKLSLSMAQLPANMIFAGDYCQYWLDVIKQGKGTLAPKTYVGYKAAIDNWIRPSLGRIKIQHLTRQQIIELFALAASKGASRSLQVQIRAVIKPALDEAVINGYISQSPFMRIPLTRKTKANPKFFTKSEVAEILKAANNHPNSLRWHLGLIYGPRQGECLGLQWSDVDLESGLVTISKQLQRVTGKGLALGATQDFQGLQKPPIGRLC